MVRSSLVVPTSRYDLVVDLLVEFLRHNTMMNQRLLAVCRELTDEQRDTGLEGTYGTVGATLVHVANSQLGYVPRHIAAERPDSLPREPFPGWEALSDRFDLGNALLEEFAARVEEEHEIEVTGDESGERYSLPVSLLLLQAVNHATEHRSQVATILTGLGIEPPEMDGWTYMLDSGRMRRL